MTSKFCLAYEKFNEILFQRVVKKVNYNPFVHSQEIESIEELNPSLNRILTYLRHSTIGPHPSRASTR